MNVDCVVCTVQPRGGGGAAGAAQPRALAGAELPAARLHPAGRLSAAAQRPHATLHRDVQVLCSVLGYK